MQKHTVKSLSKKYEDEAVNDDIIKKTLLKKAKGFVLEEICEEYAFCEDEGKGMKLTKRKVTTKEVAPDINAIKVLIELKASSKTDYSVLTDEELLKEKDKLISLLQQEEEGCSSD